MNKFKLTNVLLIVAMVFSFGMVSCDDSAASPVAIDTTETTDPTVTTDVEALKAKLTLLKEELAFVEELKVLYDAESDSAANLEAAAAAKVTLKEAITPKQDQIAHGTALKEFAESLTDPTLIEDAKAALATAKVNAMTDSFQVADLKNMSMIFLDPAWVVTTQGDFDAVKSLLFPDNNGEYNAGYNQEILASSLAVLAIGVVAEITDDMVAAARTALGVSDDTTYTAAQIIEQYEAFFKTEKDTLDRLVAQGNAVLVANNLPDTDDYKDIIVGFVSVMGEATTKAALIQLATNMLKNAATMEDDLYESSKAKILIAAANLKLAAATGETFKIPTSVVDTTLIEANSETLTALIASFGTAIAAIETKIAAAS